MKNPKSDIGKLYVVATPIGNIEDITFRAVKTLSAVDLILCEDTRQTRKLLGHYKIKAKLESCHSYNEADKAQDIVYMLLEGKSVAIVSESGTPGISDPGSLIVKAARREGIYASPLPGPSAIIAALSVSGSRSSKIFFAGFLPKVKGRRIKELLFLKKLNMTSVLYESPKRILKTLRELENFLPKRECFLARETTKLHEEFICGTPGQISKSLGHENLKGEFTLIIFPGTGEKPLESEIAARALTVMRKLDLNPSQASKLLAAQYGIPRSRIYKIVSSLNREAFDSSDDE